MKNKIWFLMIAAFAVVMVFSFASCNGQKKKGKSDALIVANSEQWKTTIDSIMSNGDNKIYTVDIIEDFSIPGTAVNTFGGLTGITVTITGDKKLSLAAGSIGSLLCIGSGQTVILQDLDLEGHDSNKYPLVFINGKAMIMRGSASVSGNAWRGVYIAEGTLTIKDSASIYGNTVTGINGGGGGVFVGRGATLIIQDDASVHGNTAAFTIDRNNRVVGGEGGGIFIGYSRYDATSGTVIMEGGSVFGNKAISGGGVCVASGGIFRLLSGSIYGNSVENNGGGIFTYGTAVMEGGTLYGNTATRNGGGVFIANGGSSTLEGVTIYGRDAEEGNKNTAEKGAATYDDNLPSGREPSDNTIR